MSGLGLATSWPSIGTLRCVATQGELDGDDSQRSRARSRPLTVRERVLSTALGLILGIFGVIAVFVTNNQAGSATLLLICGVFALLGIQGTPIRRATNTSVELADREDVVIERAKSIARTDDAREAQIFLEGAVSAQPILSKGISFQRFAGELYEMQVRQALERIGMSNGFRVQVASPDGLDYTLSGLEWLMVVGINVRYDTGYTFGGNVSRATVIAHLLRPFKAPRILISNLGLALDDQADLEARLARNPNVLFVRWSNEMGDEALESAILPFVRRVSKPTEHESD